MNGVNFILYNKKHNEFLKFDNKDLEFETHLISTSENEAILQDKIQKIKTAATRIFTELNQNRSLDRLPEILAEYDQKYWDKILTFTKLYYDINVPETTEIKIPLKSRLDKNLKDFSDGYEIIISQNKNIANDYLNFPNSGTTIAIIGFY